MLRAENHFPHVFSPLKIGPLVAKNRLEVAPAEPFLCTRDGLVTSEFIAFTSSLAKSGAAIVTVGDSPVNQTYADSNHYVVNLADPLVSHGLFELTDAIHRYGAIASLELNLRADYLPADLTVGEIHEIIADFALSAKRCVDGGFDMLMLHGGHGHTVAQFFSPFFNRRTDQYGCKTFENRCRFALEMIDAIREEIGSGRALEYRISGDDMLGAEESVGIDEVLEFAKVIEDKIDLLHVSAGNLYNEKACRYMIQGAYMPHATNVHLARHLRPHLHIPVTTVGSFDMRLAEEALANGSADMVAMIRPFIADPDQIKKAYQGREDEIRPCLRCNNCAGEGPRSMCAKPLRCSVNAVAGRELFFTETPPAQEPKRVAIVGGGCAGLEAARRLAQRGHKPIIWEKQDHLGGSLKVAGSNNVKGDVRRYAEWSIKSVEHDPRIEVHTNITMTAEHLSELSPDAVIIAVGSIPYIPDLPGITSEHVLLAEEADLNPGKVGATAVVVGGGLTGCETALMLTREGHDVTLIDRRPQSYRRGGAMAIAVAHSIFLDEGGTILYGGNLKEVTKEGALIAWADGAEELLSCDTVVLSLGVRPCKGVVEDLYTVCDETYVVGDCNNREGNILAAVREGFYAAMNI